MRKRGYRSVIFLMILAVLVVIVSCAKKPETIEPGEIMPTTTVKSEGFTEPEGCT